MFKFISTLLIALLLNSGAMGASLIDVSTRYPMTSAPGYFRLRIAVPRSEASRRICLQIQQVQNGSYYRNSCWDHIGTEAPLTTWKDIKDLNAGRYVAVVALLTNDDKWHASTPIKLSVIGFGYESEPEL